jgi:hypothetical protein
MVLPCPCIFCPQAMKQNPRVPAREPGYFSLNAKKSNQKKLCAARGISGAMFYEGSRHHGPGNEGGLLCCRNRDLWIRAFVTHHTRLIATDMLKDSGAGRITPTGPRGRAPYRQQMCRGHVYRHINDRKQNCLHQKCPPQVTGIFCLLFVAVWTKSKAPVGARPDGFISAKKKNRKLGQQPAKGHGLNSRARPALSPRSTENARQK